MVDVFLHHVGFAKHSRIRPTPSLAVLASGSV
jgi:hypothetical protein